MTKWGTIIILFFFRLVPQGEVIYTASGKSISVSTSSLLRSSLTVNNRHHQRASGMTSSSSATSSNSNKVNSDRHRGESNRDLQKTSYDGGDDCKDLGQQNRLHSQYGNFLFDKRKKNGPI